MSGFLFDTCAVSELIKPLPNASAIAWMGSVNPVTAFLSVMTLAEVRKGIEKRPNDQRRAFLEAWLFNEVPQMFSGRVLEVDADIAHRYGQIVVASEMRGMSVGVVDALIAATALRHNLSVVTRNAGDFEPLGVSVVNPWN